MIRTLPQRRKRHALVGALILASAIVVAAASACVDYLDADAGASGAQGNSAEGGERLGDADVNANDDAANDGSAAEDGTPGECDYACLVLRDKPLIYLRLDDDAAATQARDSSGNGHHGAYPQAGVTRGVDGFMAGNKAVRFAGSGPQAITMPPSANFDGTSTEFSIELWVKPDAVDGFRFILDHEVFDTRGGWLVGIQDGEISLQLYANNMTVAVAYSGSGALTVGKWHHLVFTYNSANRLAYIWVDTKVLFSTQTGTGVPLPVIDSWSIGKQNCTPCEGQSFAGTLDEVAIYAKALDENTVNLHYKASGR
jgi:hypothetical protein